VDKRYQVFVSSTFDDLQAERQEVMHALLELDCIPAGMELFPAANQDQWALIKRVIDECDYYLVIVAGRYGSIGPDGIGYTEMEYRYALEQQKPILGFVHKEPESLPAKRTEATDDGKQRLRAFRDFVRQKPCKMWTSASELGSVVSRSLVHLIKTTPAVGWVRASELPDQDLVRENAKLRQRVDELERDIRAFAERGPNEADGFAQGEDRITIPFKLDVYEASSYKTVEVKEQLQIQVAWNDIIRCVLPSLAIEGTESDIDNALEELVASRSGVVKSYVGKYRTHVDIPRTFRDQVVVQLSALGLVVPSVKQRSLRDRSSYWKQTPWGRTVMTRLCALRRPPVGGMPAAEPSAAADGGA
jgi:hypothetical protein